jgi:anti-sigma B factor antagonist
MNLQSHYIDDVLITVVMETLLNAATADTFKAPILEHIAQDTHRIVIDLSHVKMIDSTGLGAMLHCVKKAKQVNGNIVFCNAHISIVNLFKLMQLTSFFACYDDEQAAINALLPQK